MSKKRVPTISIDEASRRTGASIKQIRFWLEKGYIPEVERVVCG